MKNLWILYIVSILSAGMAPAALAADFDGSRPILCSVIKVIECTPTVVDRAATVESIGMPQFLHVDVAGRKVAPAMDREGKRVSEIKRVEHLDGMLILQGADAGVRDKRDGAGWSATISETTGKFTLTAAGEKTAFVVFGACLPQ
ncbi:MAG TPA: hypothetical protein VFG28_02365 [Syntrophales bacterium]|nr:hypothetical protein [Syntrophales bacterium]